MYTLKTPTSFLRTAKKFFKHHPELKDRFKDIVNLLQDNPHTPALKMQALSGKLARMHAICQRAVKVYH